MMGLILKGGCEVSQDMGTLYVLNISWQADMQRAEKKEKERVLTFGAAYLKNAEKAAHTF